MSLEAQISLMTVPQEFIRLCNAVLIAEHGDDFLPIDDDRGDRGNDGYLKSQRRMFAGHCFKRVQNQSLDRAILTKMVGDLGKATALKQAGIWEVDAWTFVSNYPIPEEIGARIMVLGHEAGIDVSWRGADYLADGLQRHRSVRERFPALQVSEITERLGALHDAIRDPDADLFHGIPETPAQQRRLIAGRPPGWEYLLFAGVILQERQAWKSSGMTTG